MSTLKRLSQAYASAKIIPFDENSQFVIISDCHRGDGTRGDDFSYNQNLYYAALFYYYKAGFTYIELGDGDELWENKNIEDIISAHKDVFWLISRFHKKGRLHMVYGNHDIIKGNPSYVKTKYGTYYSERTKRSIDLFPQIKISESILLKNNNTHQQIFLTHGHQADFFNDTLWKVSRYLVLYLWHPVEAFGLKSPASVLKNKLKKNIVETKLIRWITINKQMLIAGHTHRPYFPKAGEPPYFNSGCCVNPRYITALEIKGGTIVLVKWAVMTSKDLTLYVGRKEITSPVKLSEYFNSL
jgi:predicted phosphodiesterase